MNIATDSFRRATYWRACSTKRRLRGGVAKKKVAVESEKSAQEARREARYTGIGSLTRNSVSPGSEVNVTDP